MSQGPPDTQGPVKWLVVAVLFVVSAINYADRSSITAVFPLLKSDLGFTDVGLGAIGSMFLWGYALACPFAGFLGDRLSRRLVIITSLGLWSFITLLAGLVNAQWELLGIRFLLGAAEALYLPSAMALVADYHDSRTLATALAALSVGNYVGLLGGGVIGGYLGEHFGWRAPLCVLGVFGLIYAVFCQSVLPHWRVHEEKKPTHSITARQWVQASGTLFRIPSFVVLMMAGVLTSIGAWIFINWLPLYFHESFGMSLTRAGVLGSSAVPVAAALSQLAGGPLSDLAARRGLHKRLLLQASLILLAAPTLLVFLVAHSLTLVILALVLYSVFRSCGDLNMIPLLSDLAGPDRRSTAFGITNMVNTLAGGLGVFVAGFLKAQFGLAGVFAGIGVILAMDAAMLFTGYALFVRKDLRETAASR